MKPKMTYSETLSLLSEIVNERPDYQYRMINGECLYRDPVTFEPSCIVGHFLDRSGVAELRTEEFQYEGMRAPAVVSAYLDADTRSHMLLARVQEYQDEGLAWGESLDEALATLALTEAV